MTTTPESPGPTGRQAPSARRTTAVFLLCHGLRWLPVGFVLPILVLVPTERGLDLPTVGLVFATYGVTTAVLELPTGGLADALGRKPVLLVATIADTGLLLALAFGSLAWHFVVGAVVGGVGRALLTGPLESWYVDTVRGIAPAIPLRPGLSSAGLVEGGALAAGALLSAVLPTVGGGLPVDGTVSQLTLPVYGGLVAEVASFVAVLSLLREPARPSRNALATELRSVPTVVGDGLKLAVRTRDLRLLSAVSVVVAVAMVGVEVLWQPRFAQLLGGTSEATRTFGYVVVGMSLGAGGGAWLADRLPGVLARRAAVAAAAGTALAAAAMMGLALAPSFAVAAAAFIAVYAARALGGVAEAEALHERVPSGRRATMVSVQSLAQQLGNVVASLGLTRVAAAQGIPFAWGVGTALLVVSSALLLFVREGPPVPADAGVSR